MSVWLFIDIFHSISHKDEVFLRITFICYALIVFQFVCFNILIFCCCCCCCSSGGCAGSDHVCPGQGIPISGVVGLKAAAAAAATLKKNK